MCERHRVFILVYVCVSQHLFFINICERVKRENKSISTSVFVCMCIKIAKVKKSCGDGLNDEAGNFHSHSHVRGDLNGNHTLLHVKFWSILL